MLPPIVDRHVSIEQGCNPHGNCEVDYRAPYCMMVTLELCPKGEAEFNDICDNDHIPTMVMQRDQARSIIRAPEPSAKTAHCRRRQAALHDG